MIRTRNFIALTVFIISMNAQAEQLVVRSSADSGPHTLRDALSRASDNDVIRFDLPDGEDVITLNSELYVRSASVTIDGSLLQDGYPGRVTVQVRQPGLSPHRIFRLQLPGRKRVLLQNLILLGGDVSASAQRPDGGVIHMSGHGSLHLHGCVIRDGKARRGGGIFAGETYRRGLLLLDGCEITANESIARDDDAAGGGAFVSFGRLALLSTHIRSNQSGTHSGGIVLQNGSAEITDSFIEGNAAVDAAAVEASFSGPSLTIRKSIFPTRTEPAFVHRLIDSSVSASQARLLDQE